MGTGAATWTVAAVARRLGVAPATLRTWDRRYGLGPSQHRAGEHRRYSEADVARLKQMCDLLRQGVTTAQAAALVLAGTPEALSRRASRLVAATNPSATEDGARDRRWRRGLSRAGAALDTPALLELIVAAFADRGVVLAWEQLLRPVLDEAGRRWAETGEGIDVEHMLSDCIAAALHQRVLRAPPPEPGYRPTLLACAAQDQHQLPLHVLRAAVREQRMPARLLGAATPLGALGNACRRIGPSSVVVWSQLRPTADADLFAGIPLLRPRPRVFAAGPGWDDVMLPSGVHRLSSLPQALEEVCAAAGLDVAGQAEPDS